MPVLPLVPSTIAPPGFSSPEASAASMMAMPMRSFTLDPGLKYSSLAITVPGRPSETRLSVTRGVLPNALVMSEWMPDMVCLSCGRGGAVVSRAGTRGRAPTDRTSLGGTAIPVRIVTILHG